MLLPLAFLDEILFSRLIRHFTLSGMTTENYLSTVFGNHKVTVHPYLTAGLAQLSKFGQESPAELLFFQTLAPLFIFFLPSHKSTISLGLVSINATEAIRACQLVCVREKESLSIKYCPECARTDAQNFGVSYWHRSHQVPGIESCSSHQIQLVHFPLKGRSRLNLGLYPPLDVESTPCSKLSLEFAQYSYDVLQQVSQNGKGFKLEYFKEQLNKHGYVTNKGHYRRKHILKNLYQFTQGLAHNTEPLFPHSPADYRYISYLLSEKVTQHPIKYLLLGFWLSKHALYEEQNESVLIESDPIDQIEKKSIELLHQGESMASVSRIIGKSRCYVKALALRLNIPINLKPKKITENMKLQIMFLAKKGFHRKAIAEGVGVSIGSAEQQISTSPELVQWRKQCRHESKRRRYKVQIIRFMQQHPTAIRQQIKFSCSAAFFWLYLHERGWLESTLPPAQRPLTKPRIDWHQRDIALITQISLIMQQHQNRLSRTKLDTLLGGHGWLTKKKHKLPLTLIRYNLLNNAK
jgi:hypothetical protein